MQISTDFSKSCPKLKDIITRADQPNKLKKEKMKKQINQSLTWYDGLRDMDACPQSRHPEERDETKIITHDYRRKIQLNTAEERDTHKTWWAHAKPAALSKDFKG